MLRNYLISAIRNIRRNRLISIINIAGLAMGLGLFILLSAYIIDELKYDKHHEDPDRIFRMTTDFRPNSYKMATSSPPIARVIEQEVPGIKHAARIFHPPGVSEHLLRYEDKSFYISNGFIADSSIFRILTFDFIKGNPSTCLDQPNTVVLSRDVAERFFGHNEALNNVLSITDNSGTFDYLVTGVYDKTTFNSHINPEFITSFQSEGWAEWVNEIDTWAGQNFIYTYIKIHEGTRPAEVEKTINDVVLEYGKDDFEEAEITKVHSLQPVKDIYLTGNYRAEVSQKGNITYVYVLGFIAVFILTLASINFINLTTARATIRTAEIGIRKVLGASRGNLVQQFLGEAFIIVFISLVLAIVAVVYILPYFNQLTGKEIVFQDLKQNTMILVIIGTAVLTALLAGLYPSFYLSGFNPVKILRSGKVPGQSSSSLRKYLVVFQYFIAICLITGVIVIYKQIQFSARMDLGFDTSARIAIPLKTKEAEDSYTILKNEFKNIAEIKGVSGSNYIPGNRVLSDFRLYKKGQSNKNAETIKLNRVDNEYISLMNIDLLAGRNFDENYVEGQVIINRKAARTFNWRDEEAVGQQLFYEFNDQKGYFTVIGVMDDFHQISSHHPVVPVMFEMEEDKSYDNILIQVDPTEINSGLSLVEEEWNNLVPDTPFDYKFLDDNIIAQYAGDKRNMNMILSFAILAILISNLGLYGLTVFYVERRKKEIGIRKVLGAGLRSLITLISMRFYRLIFIALILSLPLTYYLSDVWLSNYAYHINIGWEIFLIALGITLIVASLTVLQQTIKATRIDPVKTLQDE